MTKAAFTVFLLSTILFVSCDSDSIDPQSKDYQDQSVGASANHLLASTVFTSLRVEIVYVAGYEPTDAAINGLKSFLQARLNKPQGITIQKTEIASPGLAPYSINDISQTESNSRTLENSNNSLSVFVYVADGDYAENDNVLGVAYKNTSLALFGSKIHSISGGIGQPSRALVETTVLTH